MTNPKGNPGIFCCGCAAHKKCEFPYPILQLSLCSEDTYNQIRITNSGPWFQKREDPLLRVSCFRQIAFMHAKI